MNLYINFIVWCGTVRYNRSAHALVTQIFFFGGGVNEFIYKLYCLMWYSPVQQICTRPCHAIFKFRTKQNRRTERCTSLLAKIQLHRLKHSEIVWPLKATNALVASKSATSRSTPFSLLLPATGHPHNFMCSPWPLLIVKPNEKCALLGRYAASSGNFLPTFFGKPTGLRMGPIGCPETSVRNAHYSLRNAPRRVHFSAKPEITHLNRLLKCSTVADSALNAQPRRPEY